MIRFFLILFLFISYGNFNFIINDLVLFSLINIAFFSILKEKKIQIIDFSIYIFSTVIIEILVGLPLFISSSIIILPIFLFSYLLNNLSMHIIFNSIAGFLSSLLVLFLFDQSIFLRIFNIQYLLTIIILISIYLGFSNRGKE